MEPTSPRVTSEFLSKKYFDWFIPIVLAWLPLPVSSVNVVESTLQLQRTNQKAGKHVYLHSKDRYLTAV